MPRPPSLTGTNDFAFLQGFTTTGALAVSDAAPFSVSGPVSAGGSLSLSSASALTLAADVMAPSISLNGGGGIVPERGPA